MKIKSSVTFGDITSNIGYIKVFWNGELVYNDEFGDSTIEEFKEFQEKYNSKIIYKVYMEVVDFHHFIMKITGE